MKLLFRLQTPYLKSVNFLRQQRYPEGQVAQLSFGHLRSLPTTTREQLAAQYCMHYSNSSRILRQVMMTLSARLIICFRADGGEL